MCWCLSSTADDYAVAIADLLKQRSSSVRVRVLMDELGSLFAGQVPPQTAMPPDFVSPGDIQSYLSSGSHVKVRATANHRLTIDHRKCIIIDGKQAYLGGMNIGREYRSEWHDMMVGLKGPIVGWLEKDAAKPGLTRAGSATSATSGPPCSTAGIPKSSLSPTPLTSGRCARQPPSSKSTAPRLAAIEQAKSRIYLENAYFDDGMTLRALIRARQRGVDVRVVVPAENDSGIMQTSNLMIANTLLESGIRVYAYPGMTHVKAAIYDGWACLGSANFDKMSLRISTGTRQSPSPIPPPLRASNKRLLETDFARSRELKGSVPVEWLDSFVKALADQL